MITQERLAELLSFAIYGEMDRYDGEELVLEIRQLLKKYYALRDAANEWRRTFKNTRLPDSTDADDYEHGSSQGKLLALLEEREK